MGVREITLTALLGRHVHDADGAHVGRIEEVRARRGPEGCFVTEYLVGSLGLAERLAIGPLTRSILRRVPRLYRGYCVPWDRLDLSNPEHPRTRCRREELHDES